MARPVETVEISKKAREVLQAMAGGAALWRGALGCRVEGYGGVSCEAFDELLEARLIEWRTGKLVEGPEHAVRDRGKGARGGG